MDVEIKNGGAGGDIGVHVDQNAQLHTFSITESERNAAVEQGKAYNLNTGIIALTGTSDSAVFYMKNTEAPINGQTDIVIDTIIVGINTRSTTITEDPVITVVRNPTAGTIIDDANVISINSNSNFGSNNTLDSLVYSASATGKTLTDGTDHAMVIASTSRTTIPELNIDLPKGSSIGVKIDLNTSGGANVYVAVVCHRKDGSND
jgi:hypothetical protein